ncbi:MAG: hypothetical protein AAB336_13625 [Acidobacteriota bacterium]
MKDTKAFQVIHSIAANRVMSNIPQADLLNTIADKLKVIENNSVINVSFGYLNNETDSVGEISETTKLMVLMKVLELLSEIYEIELSASELGFANDLLDEIGVGYFNDKKLNSGFAERKREEGYKIDFQDAEKSLQKRIVSVLEDVLSN